VINTRPLAASRSLSDTSDQIWRAFDVPATSAQANCELPLIGEYKPRPPADSTVKSGHYQRLSRRGHYMYRQV